jgi:Stress responsive A/B Barrel Domain
VTGPFRHVVLLTWKDGTEAAAIGAVVDGLAGLPAVIPELREYHFGTDLGIAEGNADFAIVGDFDDIEAWRRYQEHPEHQRVIAELIRPILASRVAVQVAQPTGTKDDRAGESDR